MTDRKPHGGAAFPSPGSIDWGVHPEPGMTLRDWFAGQALMGFLAYSPDFYVSKTPADMAVRMYEMADAMIAERSK